MALAAIAMALTPYVIWKRMMWHLWWRHSGILKNLGDHIGHETKNVISFSLFICNQLDEMININFIRNKKEFSSILKTSKLNICP
jgi:hypothetical protein